MARASLPTLDLREYRSGDAAIREQFVGKLGEALADIGFFALAGHGIPSELIDAAYREARLFFTRPDPEKRRYSLEAGQYQRGFVPFGTEHARDTDAPDLKEFWQTGRSLPAGHRLEQEYARNVWPDELQPSFRPAVDGLYREMEALGSTLLEAASRALGMAPDWLPEMATDGNTILRLIHYPPVAGAVPGAVRSAQHEDINLITLLVGSTADGLEVMDHDGRWIQVDAGHDTIIVDSGDMMQNLTNGVFPATTHRVVNPEDAASERFSMPLFVHPRSEVDLSPRPEFIERCGGEARYPRITAGEYLHQRLVEIGLAEKGS